MRLLTAVAALGQGTFILTGTDRMAERPIQDLIDALEQVGVQIQAMNGNGCPPVKAKLSSLSSYGMKPIKARLWSMKLASLPPG